MNPTRTAVRAALVLPWSEAIARLAAERERARTCAAQAKTLPDLVALAALYGEAKAEMDGIIAGLSVALAEGQKQATMASSSSVRAEERGSFGPMRASAVVERLRHF
jgi:hypothetical protein